MTEHDGNGEVRGGARVPRRWALGVGALALGSLGLAACTRSDGGAQDSGDDSDVKSIATDAYVFGYPMVLMDATRASAGPANQFANATTLPTPADRQVVRLNLDTLYSQAWLDLSAEPLVLQVPEMPGNRYWLMQIMDAWSNTRHHPSSVEPDSPAPFTYLVAGPGWSGTVPEGMTRLDMPTPVAWVLGRIQVNGRGDLDAVRALQDRLKLVPLSAWLRGETAATGRPATAAATPPPKQVEAMDGRAFFDKLCALMATNPPAPEDAPAMQRFATIGITPGGTVDQPAEVLDAAVGQARTGIPDYSDPDTKHQNGWTFSTDLGAYGTNYPLRARTAWQGLGANLAADAVYPSLFGKADENGTAVQYRLHFPPGQLPPVAAFWSLTAYDADSYLVPNQADIHAVGHEFPVVPNSDGSVDLAIQNADPGTTVPRGNWLPIPPAGNFSLTMRLYAPHRSAIEGTWQPPKLTAVR
ncbi:DUF1254 domain-containing protein [Nocardia mexicana]|uniref:DUF1254 domain-containing protein n=1 Tax=Nocardia mexicana TaxID=279262 RepID=A0A370H0G8_9NOCA|nr:DUF1254 domain-containing protein [Nocardia mexicana]RDI49424.1 hypothetical protein DFR68_107552 [Nocardia mexicana]